ncbi:MAG: hypothetical protein ACRDT2_17745, partial [Natronosporangium sp.]
MVYVRLAQDWTDPSGSKHQAGDTVDVDAATLAELEAGGVVEEAPEGGWPAPTGGGGGGGGGDTEGGWPAPTGGGGGSTDGGWP